MEDLFTLDLEYETSLSESIGAKFSISSSGHLFCSMDCWFSWFWEDYLFTSPISETKQAVPELRHQTQMIWSLIQGRWKTRNHLLFHQVLSIRGLCPCLPSHYFLWFRALDSLEPSNNMSAFLSFTELYSQFRRLLFSSSTASGSFAQPFSH